MKDCTDCYKPKLAEFLLMHGMEFAITVLLIFVSVSLVAVLGIPFAVDRYRMAACQHEFVYYQVTKLVVPGEDRAYSYSAYIDGTILPKNTAVPLEVTMYICTKCGRTGELK